VGATPPPEEFEKIETGLGELAEVYKTEPSNVSAEEPSTWEFEEVYAQISLASDMIAPGHGEVWAEIKAALFRALRDFERDRFDLEEQDDAWKGQTYDEVKGNLDSSFPELETAANGAELQGLLVQAFESTILTTRENIVPLWDDYQNSKKVTEFWDDTKGQYDTYARDVMQDYADAINAIAKNNPVFTDAGIPELGQDDGDDGSDTTGGGGSEGFDGLGSPNGPGPFTGTEIPDFGSATVPDLTDTTPALPIANPSGLNNPTDAVRAASDAARNGLGSATDAAKQAADSAHKPSLAGPGDPPEGVLGLGPKGLGDSPRGGGAGGKTGAGAGPRLPRGLADGRPTGAATTSATRLPSVAGPVTGAGPGMMGPPGAGAPTGAQRGGDNNNGHQVLKALRRKKNGQDVVGDADAVVPVLGARERPAKSNADQSDQADHPATDVRPVPRGAHRPEQATQVQNP
jgi:hypothetical protein